MVQKGYRESSQGREEVHKKYVAKLENRKAAGLSQMVNSFMKFGREGIVTMTVMFSNWIPWENKYALRRWR